MVWMSIFRMEDEAWDSRFLGNIDIKGHDVASQYSKFNTIIKVMVQLFLCLIQQQTTQQSHLGQWQYISTHILGLWISWMISFKALWRYMEHTDYWAGWSPVHLDSVEVFFFSLPARNAASSSATTMTFCDWVCNFLPLVLQVLQYGIRPGSAVTDDVAYRPRWWVSRRCSDCVRS